LYGASKLLGLPAEIVDASAASEGPAIAVRYNWWLRGRRPARIKRFSQQLLEKCRALQPRWLLTTGHAPVEAEVLRAIGAMGITCANYSTDDPWNPALRAPWFLEGLPCYHHVFSPRRANLDEFLRAGCGQVSYLPFAYNPKVHFWEDSAAASPAGDRDRDVDHDVVFVGGADRDRLPWVTALIREGFKLGLYGGYWDRQGATKPYAMGFADPEALSRITSRSKVSLCLVRRANRDGHCMRSFEIPASGGCMLAEDTEDHRVLFGEEGRAVRYFSSIPEMLEKTRWLLADAAERERLRHATHRLIVTGQHTYADRLHSMMAAAVERAPTA